MSHIIPCVSIVGLAFGTNVAVVEPTSLFGCTIGGDTKLGFRGNSSPTGTATLLNIMNTNSSPINSCRGGRLLPSGIVNVEFGPHVTVVEPVNLYGCTIGEGCFIGPFVEIQSDAAVGARTKVQSHSFICSRVEIGEDCFIGHGVMFVNDTFAKGGPARGDKSLWGSTLIGNRVSIGSNATILPVRICDRVVIGAGAVVTKDIAEPGIYVGNPARLLRAI